MNETCCIEGYIYIITNSINDQVYIGQTTLSDLNQRFREHIKSSKRFPFRKLYKAFADIGIDYFSIALIETVPIDKLNEQEQYWIRRYDSFRNGYNETLGGISRTSNSYEDIIHDFLDGLSHEQLLQKYDCKTNYPIKSALVQAGIFCQEASRIEYEYQAYNHEQMVVHCGSVEETITWVRNKRETKSSDSTIIASINRAIQGRRKTAYGYRWSRKIRKETFHCDEALLQCSGIYGVVNNIDGDVVYIGSTTSSFKQRWQEHLHKYKHLNFPLYKAFREKGIEHFRFVIIECLNTTREQIYERERYWIDFYNTIYKENGLNKRRPVNSQQSAIGNERINQVKQAYQLLDDGYDNNDIANATGLSPSCVSQIRLGKRYVQTGRQYPIINDKIQARIDQHIQILQFIDTHTELTSREIAKYFALPRTKIEKMARGILPHDICLYIKSDMLKSFVFPIELSTDIPKTKEEHSKSGSVSKKCSKPSNFYSAKAHTVLQRTYPPRDELKQLIRSTPFVDVGRKYNVIDNAVRKWCKAYNLPSTVWEIRQYSDQEWKDECWNNNDNNVPQQRAILYESIIMSLLKNRNGNLALWQFEISKGTMSTARNYYKLPYLPTIQYGSTSCYYQEGQIYFMSAKDVATWLFENQYGTNIETLRTKIAASFRSGVSATLSLPDPTTCSPVTFTFVHVPEDEFYEVIQHHHVVSYAFDPKWASIVEDPSILPDFVSLDELPWVAEFKEFYGMQ